MAKSICISRLINTFKQLKPLFNNLPLQRIEVDIFPDQDPDFYFAFELSTPDDKCDEHLNQIYSSNLELDLVETNNEKLPETLYRRCHDLMQVYYPITPAWNISTIIIAPMSELLKDMDAENDQDCLNLSKDTLGFKMETEILCAESSNETLVETYCGSMEMLIHDFACKNGTLH